MALKLFDDFANLYQADRQEEMSLEDYLVACKADKSLYASAAERLLIAIGEPEMYNTNHDPRMGRIFNKRTIRRYNVFEDFYGMEETIERIVGFLRHAAQGLEERKQILYLLGPVGGGKSSLAERLKLLMERQPIYVLKAKWTDDRSKVHEEISPVFESPLGLFDPVTLGKQLEDECGIPRRRLTGIPSPWAVKRLREQFGGDITQFTVVRLMPSRLNQIGIAKTEPGDDNNQDIASLVGRVAIRKLEKFSQDDTDAYEYSGALNRTTLGLMEFVEMFKAPIKMLHPLLTATQEGNYAGTENIGGIPYQGIILAHSNEAEWQSFKANKNNEAFIDRISLIKVPYCLRRTEEEGIYRKMLESSELAGAPLAPKTLELLASVAVFSRLALVYRDAKSEKSEPIPASGFHSKLRRYDGEDLRDTDPKARTMQEYRDGAGVDEGMDGISTRFAYKVLSGTFNFDTDEVAADPVHMLYVLDQIILREQFPEDLETRYREFIKKEVTPRYADFLEEEIQKAVLESHSTVGQQIFDRYVAHADAWLEENDYKDPDTGNLVKRDTLERELGKIEKIGGVTQAKDFRNEVVKWVLRIRGGTGPNPQWTRYEKMRIVIEKKMFADIENLLAIISYGAKNDTDAEEKHNDFIKRMVARGYTERQVRRLVEWHLLLKEQSK